MPVIAHMLEYRGPQLRSELTVRLYRTTDYETYCSIYNESFRPMRAALSRSPLDCCENQASLFQKRDSLFILEGNGRMVGSVRLCGHEIDDLIIAKEFRGKGYGTALLRFAIATLQQRGISPITLHVADWNQNALKLYLANNFVILQTETVL